ncbi:MAG: biopolymer transporter ExbD [Sphaerochaetaceae bacterium]
MRRRKLTGIEPNDIAFLLILFFLILTVISVEYSLDITAGEEGISEASDEVLNLTLTKGSLYSENQKVDVSQFFSQLALGQRVNLTIDSEVSWQTVITTLDCLNQRRTIVNLRRM